MKVEKVSFQYKLTPKSPSEDMYKAGVNILTLITDHDRGGVPTSALDSYEFNVGARRIEISLTNVRMPKKIIDELSKEWNIATPYAVEQIPI